MDVDDDDERLGDETDIKGKGNFEKELGENQETKISNFYTPIFLHSLATLHYACMKNR